MNIEKSPEGSSQDAERQGIQNAWEQLSGVPFSQAEQSKNSPEDLELMKLRNEVLGRSEEFAKREQADYAQLSFQLRRNGLAEYAQSTDAIATANPRLDRQRHQALVDYIDYKFDTNSESGQNQNDDKERNLYQQASRRRAAVCADSLGQISHRLNLQNGASAEPLLVRTNSLKNTVQDGQLQLSNAYLTYFDHPTNENRQRLDNLVSNYSNELKSNLHQLASVLPVTDNHSDLQDFLGIKLGNNLSNGYGNLHQSIMKYFEQKMHEAAKESRVKTPQEAATEAQQNQSTTPSSVEQAPPKPKSDYLFIDLK